MATIETTKAQTGVKHYIGINNKSYIISLLWSRLVVLADAKVEAVGFMEDLNTQIAIQDKPLLEETVAAKLMEPGHNWTFNTLKLVQDMGLLDNDEFNVFIQQKHNDFQRQFLSGALPATDIPKYLKTANEVTLLKSGLGKQVANFLENESNSPQDRLDMLVEVMKALFANDEYHALLEDLGNPHEMAGIDEMLALVTRVDEMAILNFLGFDQF